jgi:hypothetical protein
VLCFNKVLQGFINGYFLKMKSWIGAKVTDAKKACISLAHAGEVITNVTRNIFMPWQFESLLEQRVHPQVPLLL